jgi:hypothetical protein
MNALDVLGVIAGEPDDEHVYVVEAMLDGDRPSSCRLWMHQRY